MHWWDGGLVSFSFLHTPNFCPRSDSRKKIFWWNYTPSSMTLKLAKPEPLWAARRISYPQCTFLIRPVYRYRWPSCPFLIICEKYLSKAYEGRVTHSCGLKSTPADQNQHIPHKFLSLLVDLSRRAAGKLANVVVGQRWRHRPSSRSHGAI